MSSIIIIYKLTPRYNVLWKPKATVFDNHTLPDLSTLQYYSEITLQIYKTSETSNSRYGPERKIAWWIEWGGRLSPFPSWSNTHLYYV